MSLDLLKEFGGNQEEDPHDNPWESEFSQKGQTKNLKDDDLGDFEAPDLESAQHLPIALGPTEEQAGGSISTRDPEVLVARLGQSRSNKNLPVEADFDEDWADSNNHSEVTYSEQSNNRAVSNTLNNQKSSDPCDPVSSINVSSNSQKPGTHTSKMPSTAFLTSSQRPLVNSHFNENQDTAKSKPSAAISHAVQITPPSNIPPPSTLLHLTTNLLQTLPAEIKSLLVASRAPTGQPVTLEQASIDGVKLRLCFLRASARIIAGRKLRWKRDTRLAQSMRIGPAQAGKTGGMKLTGIDRMEGRKEDQDAAEAIRVWKQHVGSLRTGIVSANARQAAANLAVPEIAENMPVRMAKGSEGALTAPRPCVLCGLKREERVEKVDGHVEDSFGEWWTEHWGHLDCYRFWEEHASSLQQRR